MQPEKAGELARSRVRPALFWSTAENRLIAWSPALGFRLLDPSGVVLSQFPLGPGALAVAYQAETNRMLAVDSACHLTEHHAGLPSGKVRALDPAVEWDGKWKPPVLVEAHFSRGGVRVLGLTNQNALYVWDTASCKVIHELITVDGSIEESNYTAALSPDGTLMAVSYRTWPVGTENGTVGNHNRVLRIIEVERTRPVRAGALSVSEDPLFIECTWLDHKNVEQVEVLIHQRGVRVVESSREGKWASLGMAHSDPERESELEWQADVGGDDEISVLAFSSSGERVAIGVRGAVILLEGNGQVRAETTVSLENDAVVAGVFSEDENRLAVMTASGLVRVIDLGLLEWAE